MSVYLEKFILPTIEMEEKIITKRMEENGGSFGYIDNVYPCCLFSKKELTELDFQNITILYGGNGSGKSTLLNLIANKIGLKRIAPYNTSELFDAYVEQCKCRFDFDDEGFQYKCAPLNSRIVTSDDIFDYMLTARNNNEEIADETEDLKENGYDELKYGKTLKMSGIADYEAIRLQVLARRKKLSRRKFIYKIAGKEVKLNSNGETALQYFDEKLLDGCLYCLDEPENSLSPAFQKELIDVIERKSKYCGCQFIIATHSPFVLSLQGAKIYDLDSIPVDIKKWWELENSQIYFKFFEEHKDLFLENKN